MTDNTRLNKRILLLICAIGIACCAIYYQNLPDIVAVHFNAKGWPDSQSSKMLNLLISAGAHIFLTALFLALPLLINKLPVSLINLPHPEFWLTPERKKATIIELKNRLIDFCIVLNLFFIALNYLTYLANRSRPVRLNLEAFFLVFAVFLALTAIWLIKFYRRFSQKEMEKNQQI